MQQLRVPTCGEVYEHFKGNLYYVIGHAHDTESNEILVLYKHFDQKNNHHAFLWARPLSIWHKPAGDKDNPVIRFKLRPNLMSNQALVNKFKKENGV